MARSLNKVMLLGHLGRNAETSFTASGVGVSRFSIATSRRWKDQASGEWKEATNWTNVIHWRGEKLAEYLTKGKQVHVEGYLQTRSYEKDGVKHWVTEVVAEDVILCGGGNGEGRGAPLPDDPPPPSYRGSDDDVPF